MDTICLANEMMTNLQAREKTMRSLQFGLMLITPTYPHSHKCRKAFEDISQQISTSRIILRCFDDLPMLNYTLAYGWGQHEPNGLMRALTLIGNASGQLYYPIEHIAWAQDRGLISGNSGQAWRFGLILWAISLSSSILRCLLRLSDFKRRLARTQDIKEKSSLKKERTNECINLVMFTTDFLNALNWLSIRPWGGKPFPTWLVGLLGLTSSLVGLYNLLRKK